MKLGSGNGDSLIKVRNLDKKYVRGSEEIHVLQGLNLDVERGDFLAFMGPSGSGKTTLLNLLGGLDTLEADIVVRKGSNPAIDSYSALYENDHRTSTGLAGYLRERGCRRLFLAGLATDFCVQYSALDARREGFEVFIVEDGVRGIDLDGSLTSAWERMHAAGVRRICEADLEP